MEQLLKNNSKLNLKLMNKKLKSKLNYKDHFGSFLNFAKCGNPNIQLTVYLIFKLNESLIPIIIVKTIEIIRAI